MEPEPVSPPADAALVTLLRAAGGEWDPMQVALAAASLVDEARLMVLLAQRAYQRNQNEIWNAEHV